jgi:uncharacterized membrane protein (DUF106 family)
MKRMLLLAVGLGAALTYFYDPTMGERRRQDLRKKMQKMQKMGRKAKLEAGL